MKLFTFSKRVLIYYGLVREVNERGMLDRGCKKIIETGKLSRLLTTYKREHGNVE